ncbi:MAG: hypothetical protein FWH31_02625 [Streptococcaceae bacterium]|nr:hypothetical protein [Streptococcaceae bacterium]
MDRKSCQYTDRIFWLLTEAKFIKASAYYLRLMAPLRCYVLRTPFCERSTQLRCAAVRLIAIWRRNFSALQPMPFALAALAAKQTDKCPMVMRS